MSNDEQRTAAALETALGRRSFMAAVAAVTASAAAPAAAFAAPASVPAGSRRGRPGEILQPGRGPITGDTYLPSRPDEVLWGYVPTVHANMFVRAVGLDHSLEIADVAEWFEVTYELGRGRTG